MNKKETKEEFIKILFKPLVELTQIPNKKLAYKINYIIRKLIAGTLDFVNAMNYIDNNMKSAKEKPEVVVWGKVAQIVKNYFNTINARKVK
jgi:hypothetical protein